ncbi:serine/threonine-protein phosphatase [Streptomyces actinomycinicus]|uniref:Serine/threonine-protein phosphatase n=1 Tax=Streptomyces actinomycinicus TaxID=1695166 RepID=A0A937EQY2_9ACTN|nr:PP2C family protein-serine/threonine phosphatase [Streptomyces actinomycinicus]MBL1086912.1 serine/threonine-protein phosphatase [Streptomyces actinomycinicus]
MSLALFRAVTGLLPHPVVVCSASGRILAANSATRRAVDSLTTGAELAELVQDPDGLRRQLGRWMGSGSPLPGVITVCGSDGKPVRLRCHGARARWWEGPEPAVQLQLSRLDAGDRFVALSQRVELMHQQTAYRRAIAEQRAELLRRETEARDRMQRLYRLTAALAASADLTDVCEAVHKCAPQVLDAQSVLLELHVLRLVPSLGPTDSPLAPSATWVDLDRAPAKATPGAPAAFAEPAAEDALAVPAVPADAVRRVALLAEGVTLGNLVIRYAPDTAPDEEHIVAIGQQIAQAVRRAGLFEHEHRLAERLQRSLLPTLPRVGYLDIASGYAPGTQLVDVGGDWYDVHLLDEHTVGLTIGDVAGHGIAEATAMAQITTVLRTIARRSGTRPGAVLAELNGFLGTYNQGLMATACYAAYDRRTRVLRYARAGHPPPLLIEADGTARYLEGALAPPLGPVSWADYPQHEIVVPVDATLVCYTDGLIERRGESLDVGLERLLRSARSTAGLDVRDACALLLQQPDTELPDDRALLTVRFPADD